MEKINLEIFSSVAVDRKKILFVHQVSEIGGASYCMLNLLKGIDRKQFCPIVVLPHSGPLSKEITKLKIPVEFCKSLCSYPYNRSLFSYGGMKELINVYSSRNAFEHILNKIKPDVVYLNNMFLFPYLDITKRLNIKSVIHVREHWPQNQRQTQFLYLKHKILNNADKIVAINETSAAMIGDENHIPTVIYDWIDMESRREDSDLIKIIGDSPDKLKLYIFTGGLQRIKGTYEVLKAFSENVKDPNSRLLALGIPAKIELNGIKGVIRKLLNVCGIPQFIFKVKDILEHDERIIPVDPIYNITNILEHCYCSLSYFKIPHANLGMAECITLEVPVLAAYTDEALEYSYNGTLANLFPMNNYSAFVERLCNIENWRSSLCNELSHNSHKIKEQFDRSSNIQKFNNMLGQLI